MLNVQTLYFTLRTMQPGYTGTTTNLQIVLNNQKNLYLNQATPTKYLPNFPTQKNPRIQKYPSIRHPHHLKFRVPPGPCHMGTSQYMWKPRDTVVYAVFEHKKYTYCRVVVSREGWQFSTTTTLGTEENGHCREVNVPTGTNKNALCGELVNVECQWLLITLLDEVFVISRIIKVRVRVIILRLHLQLITLQDLDYQA